MAVTAKKTKHPAASLEWTLDEHQGNEDCQVWQSMLRRASCAVWAPIEGQAGDGNSVRQT